jgi:single-strand DNA-binding protein
MASDNQVTLVGNLTDDPELRFTANGAAVANFRLAVTPRVRDEGGGWRDGETSFFRVNVWRQHAENVAETLQKGMRCMVIGRLRMRSWETPEGEKRSVVEVEADEIGPSLKFATAKVDRASRGGSGGGGGGDWGGDRSGSGSGGGQFSDEPPF